jgi:hypothetical protein
MEGCHRQDTRDWYLMHYSNPVVTGGQKHTHTPQILTDKLRPTKTVHIDRFTLWRVCVGISIISFAIYKGSGDCRDNGGSGKQGGEGRFSGEGGRSRGCGCSGSGGCAVAVVVAGVVAVTVAVAVMVALARAVAVWIVGTTVAVAMAAVVALWWVGVRRW